MATKIKLKRGTRANLNSLASSNSLEAGEPILITDEDRLAVATGVSTYEEFAKVSEAVDGLTPYIGMNGNWYLGTTDTGVKAQATSAYEIYHAGGGTLSEVDFNESITDIPAHIEDATKHIDTTTAEFSGAIDETNDKLTIWDNSLLKWIRFSFTSLKTFIGTYFLKLDQTTPQTISQSPKITSLTVGRIPFSNASKQLIDDSGIVWDNGNKRMGIGKTLPLFGVDSFQAINTDSVYRISNKLLFRLQSDNLQISQPATGKQIQFINFLTGNSLMSVLDSGEVGIGTTTPKSKLQVAGGIQCGDDTAAASADKVGTTRYRETANASYVEMCVRTGASSFQWQTIVTNTW